MIFLSKIVLYPANGYDFDAADVAAYLAGLTSGVFSGAEDFPVTAAGGLKVTVGAGRGWVHPAASPATPSPSGRPTP